MEYLRGSEWRRWDFHIHTPNTKKNDQFRTPNGQDKWDYFYEEIKQYIGDGKDPQRKIAAIGITDYFSIENYKKVVSDGKLSEVIDFIFPNIELRCLPLKDGYQMNIHLLINPDFVDKVDTVILSNLKSSESGTEYCARKDDLIRYGKDLDSDISDDEVAYKKGIENFHIDFSQITNLFKIHPECNGNVLVAIPNSSVDGASAIANPSIESDLQDLFEYRKNLYKTADIIFSSNKSDIDFFLAKKTKKPEKIIPCVCGCDAHQYERIFEPMDNNNQPTKKYCWIKADPTWEGLKQILCEPEERVAIQEVCPANRVDNYRIIDKIVIEDDQTPHRFSNESIFFNENLTCIIGLKSTGKSILMQNMARAILPDEELSRFDTMYAGKNKSRFEFPVKVFWKDGLTSTYENGNDKKIIYIPQSYLNSLMDDLAEKTEIDQIIESIIEQSDDYKKLKTVFNEQLLEIQKQIENQIVDMTYTYKAIVEKTNEIRDLGNKDSIEKNIESLKKHKETLAKELSISEAEIKNYDLAVVEKANLQLEVQKLSTDRNSIKFLTNIVSINGQFDIKSSFMKTEIEKVLNKISLKLNKLWDDEKDQILSKIDEEIKNKNKYIGEKDIIINRLKPKIDNNEQIKKIEQDLRKEENSLRSINLGKDGLKQLNDKFETILKTITNLTTKRDNLYDKFEEDFKALNFENTNENFKIVAKKRYRRRYFAEEFKKIFMQNALKTMHNGVFSDMDNPELIIENEFDEDCKSDIIKVILNNNIKKVLLAKCDIDTAIKQTLKDYNNIIYTIEMDGDLIEAMSPGKKALVLLKLLISMDKSKFPIMIDQPEDDLDNMSIVSELVKFIKNRKKDRQIILVTHNANLVLGCDAEEIIVANQEIKNNSKSKNKAFQFEYRSGAIENTRIINTDTFLGSKGIQAHICEILEGGKEAFLARKNKYTNIS